MPMARRASIGDFFCTVTGNIDVIRQEHFEAMKDGAIVCQLGPLQRGDRHSRRWSKLSKGRAILREFVEEYTLKDGKRIIVLGEGRLINLAAAEGHPASVMDMSFANQALSTEYMVKNHRKLEKKVYSVPEHIDQEIARLKLRAMGVKIDKLTPAQLKYLGSWQEGT